MSSSLSLANRSPVASMMVRPVRGKLSEHFAAEELACPCDDCTRLVVHWALIELLQRLRERVGVIVVTSGYRCVEYNRRVGGVKGSLHICGMAADIQAADLDPAQLAPLARGFGAGGVGLYPRHVHVDVGDKRRWTGEYD
jgi:hypothetical protein